MRVIAESTHERIERGRVSVQPTLITRPEPPPIPEPWPPPDEGTPPQPDPVPPPEEPDS